MTTHRRSDGLEHAQDRLARARAALEQLEDAMRAERGVVDMTDPRYRALHQEYRDAERDLVDRRWKSQVHSERRRPRVGYPKDHHPGSG